MAKRVRNSKGRFVKGGSTRRRSRSRSLVVSRPSRPVVVTRYRTRHVKHRRRGRRGGGASGGVSMGKLAITGLALGAVFGENSSIAPAQAKSIVQKIPGSKTFGNTAIAGMALGAVHHFTHFGGRFRPWMKAAGLVGLALAAVKLGTDNTSFKFVGEDDDGDLMDVE
jgi:hypothetical protein